MPKDTHRTAIADRAQLQLPEQVTVVVAELASPTVWADYLAESRQRRWRVDSVQHAVAVGADNREVLQPGGPRTGCLGEGHRVVALDVAGAVGAVEGLEVEAADLASQPAVALSDLLLLALDEPAVALPDPVAPVEDAAFLGLVLAILRSRGDIPRPRRSRTRLT